MDGAGLMVRPVRQPSWIYVSHSVSDPGAPGGGWAASCDTAATDNPKLADNKPRQGPDDEATNPPGLPVEGGRHGHERLAWAWAVNGVRRDGSLRRGPPTCEWLAGQRRGLGKSPV